MMNIFYEFFGGVDYEKSVKLKLPIVCIVAGLLGSNISSQER